MTENATSAYRFVLFQPFFLSKAFHIRSVLRCIEKMQHSAENRYHEYILRVQLLPCALQYIVCASIHLFVGSSVFLQFFIHFGDTIAFSHFHIVSCFPCNEHKTVLDLLRAITVLSYLFVFFSDFFYADANSDHN